MRLFPKTSAAIAAAAALAACLPAYADDAGVSADDWLFARLILSGEQRVIDTRQLLMMNFYEADADGGGVTQSDYELLRSIQRATVRANALSKHLSRDLDGDGNVTRAELERYFLPSANKPLHSGQGVYVPPTLDQVRAIQERLVREALESDTNKNGSLEFTEMYRDVPKPAKAGSPREKGGLPGSFDADRDGTISAAEFESVVSRVLDVLDADRDGTISPQEAASVQARQQSARTAVYSAMQMEAAAAEAQEKAKRCSLPEVPGGAKLIYISAHEGKALSNLSIGGDDLEVSAGHAVIEKGEEPLYIVAASNEAMIWHVTGEVGRVAMFVAGSTQKGSHGAPRAAVSGLARDKVAIPAASDCLPTLRRATHAEREGVMLKALLGRPADATFALGAVSKVSLPSGSETDAKFPITRMLPKAGPGAVMWSEMLRYAPAGLADLEPEKVVGRLPVASYEVLPQLAGIAQLLEDGALEASGARRVRRFGKLTIVGNATVTGAEPAHEEYALPGEFRIVKKMRFPAGLSGGHSVRFVLAKGVPMPDGNPGHSEVVSEETGASLKHR